MAGPVLSQRDEAGGMKLGIEAARLLAVADCCEIAPGLSEIELQRIEQEYGFEFADDHRAFLASGLPDSQPPEEGGTWEKPWPGWWHGDPQGLRERLEWPWRALLCRSDAATGIRAGANGRRMPTRP